VEDLTMHQESSFLRRPNKYEEVYSASEIGEELQYLGFKILNIPFRSQYCFEVSEVEEGIFILLSGHAQVKFGNSISEIKRGNVFSDLPASVFLPPNTSVDIYASSNEGCCAAVAIGLISNSEEMEDGYPNTPYIIHQHEVNVFARGKGCYKRTIREIVNKNIPSRTLICGETINPAGNWSSFPPHKHDTLIPGVESCHEEIYLHLLDSPNGWGYQEIYSHEHSIREIIRIQDKDIILIPFGYHPVVVAPGYCLCYLWVLAGSNRDFAFSNDPDHTWIAD
jgi:5-deoxy-glucuronate isomerase